MQASQKPAATAPRPAAKDEPDRRDEARGPCRNGCPGCPCGGPSRGV